MAKTLKEALQARPSELPEGELVTVDAGGLQIRADLRASGPVGCRLRVLEIERGSPAPSRPGQLSEQAHRAAAVPTGGDRLRVIEIDPVHGEALLRSDPADMSERTWLELNLRAGQRARLGRLQYNPETTTREPRDIPFTWESLERVVGDLGRILEGDEDG